MNIRILLLVGLLYAALTSQGQVSNSVLANGDWYKIAVFEDGVYRVDANFLNQLGIPSSVDSRRVTIYGNSYNGMLPQPNADLRPDDLEEIPTFDSGLSDGSFDNGDFLLFYGKSPDGITHDPEEGTFAFEKNLYSDTAFYFLTIKDELALKIVSEDNPTSAPSFETSYLKFVPHEVDEYNILRTGRLWLGERMTNNSNRAQIEFQNIDPIPGSQIDLNVRMLAFDNRSNSHFTLRTDSRMLGNIVMNNVSSESYRTRADIQERTYQIHPDSIEGSDLTIDFEYSNSGGAPEGYVDYAHITVEEWLDFSDGPISIYRSSENQGYAISNATASSQIWNVSQPTKPTFINWEMNEGIAEFGAQGDELKYYAFNESDHKVPISMGRINNQNLHALGPAEVIYITHKNFESEALRLAEFRTAFSGLLAEVVRVDEIYNEYSSGRQDLVAIRDFIRHQYLKHGQRLKYITLFGDCSYDYKDRSFEDTNFVPIYEARNSIHQIRSFSSDDFFGFMEEEEGEWAESLAGDHTLELGIGRIPVHNNEEATQYVDKIIRYQTSIEGFGKWRNKITFIADDGDRNIHMEDADSLAKIILENQDVFNVEKIYLDAFEQLESPDGETSPKASTSFVDALTKGNLIVNFTGHGNEYELTHESIFTNEMILDLSNRILMPFFVTATCEYGNYDNPAVVSGGEQIFLHPQGGAIGLLCSTRPVYASSNYDLNKAFYEAVVSQEDGIFRRLGDIMIDTKNNSLEAAQNRNYALLGDASMRLAFPKNSIQLTHINGQDITTQIDTLNALGKYNIEGQIMENGNFDDDFNGSVFVSVYDKPAEFRTYGNESDPLIFENQDVLLFQGESTVSNGRFSTEFIVPKNINYSFSQGKISFYAVNDIPNSDAHGAYSEVVVGGSSNDFTEDNNPPQVEIFFGGQNLSPSQPVESNTLFKAHLTDESGINISKLGFGYDLTLFIDEEEFIVNEFYTATLDTYQEGWIAFPLENLEAGNHMARLVAYDIHNNRAEHEVEFFVESENKLNLYQISTYPNPVQSSTQISNFSFHHDRPGEELRVTLAITNLNGEEILKNYYRLVGNFHDCTNQSTEGFANCFEWNGLDAWGSRLKKGLYIYKIIVQSEVDGAKSAKYHKLVVLN